MIRVITGDESWILEYDPETKPQSRDRPQGMCATRTDCQSNFLSGSPWKTQEKGGTCVTMHRTHLDAAPRQRPMSHGSLHQWIFDRKKTFLWFLSPTIRRISVPVTSFYSPGSKNNLKGRHFGTLDNIHKRVTDELKGIPAEAFQHCCEQWKQRLRRCVAAQGNYFEGDNLDFWRE